MKSTVKSTTKTVTEAVPGATKGTTVTMKERAKKRLFDMVMPLLPKGGLSRGVGHLVHMKIPGPIGRKSVEWFAKYYNIDLSEAEFPIDRYGSIGELFTRRLKPGARPIEAGAVHPADSVISEAGVIQGKSLMQAKGRMYSLAELLHSEKWAGVFEGGTFFTYYLCPTDYHRVHAPVGGNVVWSCHIPGEFWPVNAWSVNAVDRLFAVNERVAAVFETPQGRVAVVMVAATNVGDIGVAFDEEIATNSPLAFEARERVYDPPKAMAKGDEFGVFRMGSTVIVLYEKNMIPSEICESMLGQRVRVGQTLTALMATSSVEDPDQN